MRRLVLVVTLVATFGLLAGPARAAETTEEQRPRPEPLRLACQGFVRDGQPAIACRWSQSHHPGFAQYRLWRATKGEERTVVFRTDERDHTLYVDRNVEAGVAYSYAIQAIDGEGHTVGFGGPVRAGVRPQPESLIALPAARRTRTAR